MEFEAFQDIRNQYCLRYEKVTQGKMMSSPAIHYEGKVFAFFSRKKRMVFKLGKNYPWETLSYPLAEFSPFKTKGPLKGWYELAFTSKNSWEEMTQLALEIIKNEKSS